MVQHVAFFDRGNVSHIGNAAGIPTNNVDLWHREALVFGWPDGYRVKNGNDIEAYQTVLFGRLLSGKEARQVLAAGGDQIIKLDKRLNGSAPERIVQARSGTLYGFSREAMRPGTGDVVVCRMALSR